MSPNKKVAWTIAELLGCEILFLRNEIEKGLMDNGQWTADSCAKCS